MAENDDIPFNKNFPLKPGVVEEVVPGVRRVLCDNPSPFTFTGTLSYIVGKGKVAIIDPGPDSEAHAKALLDAVRGETVTHILVTHTHRDHSPNTPRIRLATGAPVYAEGPHRASRPRHESERHNPESGADRGFRPDIEVRSGDVIEGDGFRLEAVATPGHTANHMTFAWPERKMSFVGDHVMGWSTSIVAPPDGSMVDYMASLERLTNRDENLYFSGHGPEIPDGARDLYRHRSAPGDGSRLFGAGASRRPRRAGHRRNRRRSGHWRDVSARVLISPRRNGEKPHTAYFLTVLAGGAFGGGAAIFFAGFCASASAAAERSSMNFVTRAALEPRSLSK